MMVVVMMMMMMMMTTTTTTTALLTVAVGVHHVASQPVPPSPLVSISLGAQSSVHTNWQELQSRFTVSSYCCNVL
jgi:biopolymer transport protein ExbD